MGGERREARAQAINIVHSMMAMMIPSESWVARWQRTSMLSSYHLRSFLSLLITYHHYSILSPPDIFFFPLPLFSLFPTHYCHLPYYLLYHTLITCPPYANGSTLSHVIHCPTFPCSFMFPRLVSSFAPILLLFFHPILPSYEPCTSYPCPKSIPYCLPSTSHLSPSFSPRSFSSLPRLPRLPSILTT